MRNPHILTVNWCGVVHGDILNYSCLAPGNWAAISFSDIMRFLWIGALTGPQKERYFYFRLISQIPSLSYNQF